MIVWSSVAIRRASSSRRRRCLETIDIAKTIAGVEFILRPAPKRRKRLNSRTAGPAETAAARIDWANWLRSLSRRQRAIAGTLANGETTGVAARKFRISAARISHVRSWFKENWEQFHGHERSGKHAHSGQVKTVQ